MVWCVTARSPIATSEQKFVQYFKDEPKKITYVGSDKSENHEEYVNTYPWYEFSYKISDPHTHDYKGQEETRNGDKVNGDYWLVEPDGRKRIVKYHATDKIGFNVLVDYLQKKRPYPSQLKDQESRENSEEGSAEKNNKANDEKSSNQENVSSNSVKDKNYNESRNSKENNNSKELQETKDLNNNKSGEDNKGTQSRSEKEAVPKSQVEISSKTKEGTMKENMRRRPYWKNENKISNNDQNTQSKSNEDGSNEERKEWGKRTHIPNYKKQEKKNESKNSNEVSRENETESKNSQKLPESEKPISKGYEVYEEINENTEESNNVSQNNQIKEEGSEDKNAQQSMTNGSTEKSENETNKKNQSGENENNKEEIYGYNTFIYHKRRHGRH
ncbi:unnamed protein product [Colias eurytheme]|nr:unnamed protein product [Colias eurytheme]